MDTALLVASASLSVYIPGCVSNYHHTNNRAELFSKCIAIALCLGLFSLTVLEAVPVSLLTWLSTDNDHDDDETSVWSIAHAYWILLWCLVILILVILPSLMGISLAHTVSSSLRYYFTAEGDNKKDPFGLDRCCPWWLKLIFHVIKGIFCNIFRLLCRVVLCASRSSKRSSSNNSGNSNIILPMTTNTIANKSTESLASLTGDNRSLPVSNTRTSIGATLLGGLGGILVALLSLRTFGPLVVQPTLTDHSILSLAVSWLCGWGLLVSSILNGFGSVSMPHASLTGLYLKPVPPEVIAKLQAERESVKQTLESKRQSLKEANVTIPSPTSGNVFSTKTTKNTFSTMGDELSNRRNILQTEIDFLENLCQEMAEDIEELKYTQIQAAAARTTMGRIRFYVGVVFSIILLIRLFSAALNIWRSYTMNVDRQKHSQPDLVTSILALLLGHNLVSSEKVVSMLSQVISLALTAFLSFSQVRVFVKTMHAVNRKLNGFCSHVVCNRQTTKQQQQQQLLETKSHHGAVEDQHHHHHGALSLYGGAMGYLAILTGCCYTLTCIVSIKTMLPDEYCVGFAKALGGSMDVFTIHTAMVNEVFATSAAVSAFVLGVLFGIQRDNNFRHTSTSSSSSSKAITMNGTSGTSTNKYRGAEAC
mmetsp:Transcript_45359/g.109855  ORF Transcript_45359/g.109855 Transcript_45359/m.109855 type:complete len:649 (+) Transcript_45359:31-1977(+)